MNQNKLAQKRFNKRLKRKNKKYSGPKYAKVEQLFQWVPLLTKAGILPEPEEGIFRQPKVTDNMRMAQPMTTEDHKYLTKKKATVIGKDGKESTTSFTSE